MEQERNEVYERIPWETLEKKKSDRQWIMFAVAGAVVLGALAYSFVSNRPQAPPPPSVVAEAVPAAEPAQPPGTVPAVAAGTAPDVPVPPASEAPVVVAEADLFAVNPERLIDQAAAHAEWFVAEYFTVDGSEQHDNTLALLMPAGVPLPSAPEGTRVFVESVGSLGVTELEPLRYEVVVLVRYLLSRDEEEIYRRQLPVTATVEVVVGDTGPRIALPPRIAVATPPSQEQLVLTEVPAEVADAAKALSQATEIVGGTQSPDGGWSVVVLAPGADNVIRPVWVQVP